MDGVGGGTSEDDQMIREAIATEMKGQTVVLALTDMDAARSSDHVIQVKPDGSVRDGNPSTILDAS